VTDLVRREAICLYYYIAEIIGSLFIWPSISFRL